jgi:hypothetical protein
MIKITWLNYRKSDRGLNEGFRDQGSANSPFSPDEQGNLGFSRFQSNPYFL